MSKRRRLEDREHVDSHYAGPGGASCYDTWFQEEIETAVSALEDNLIHQCDGDNDAAVRVIDAVIARLRAVQRRLCEGPPAGPGEGPDAKAY